MSTMNITQTGEMAALNVGGETPATENKPSLKALFGSRNFMLLWIGEAISLIGDQFYMIALPWLILQLTGDAFAMGMVLALGGIPRALFMLVGGALTDRFSPRSVMLTSNLLRMVLVAVLAGTVLTGTIEVWMIYIFALLFGLMDAFFYPAQNTIVPRLVETAQLQTANAIVMMTQQLSLFGGPVLAGALITLLSGTQSSETITDLNGIGMAFVIDAFTFLASAATLWFITTRPVKKKNAGESENVLAAIGDGLRYVRQNATLRSVFTLIVFANVLIMAPMVVGIPVLADMRLTAGAAAFGIIMSAYGGGNVLGMILGGVLPRPSDRLLGIILLSVWSTMGIATALFGLVEVTLAGAVLGALMGAANGYVVIVFITWLQTNTPESMMGRIMSLFSLSTIGLSPIANAVMGAMISWSLSAAFMISGLAMTGLVLISMILTPALRNMEMSQTPSQDEV